MITGPGSAYSARGSSDQALLPVVRSLGDLLSDPRLSDPPRFIVPGIVEAGAVTLLSGAPKAGKSTLASQLAADFSRGHPMLDGQPMGPGSVLWVAVDEPLRRLTLRFKQLDADEENFRVVERSRNRLTPALFSELLEAENPTLVVIDTLSQLALDIGVKMNDAESVVPFFKELVSAVQARENCGALLLYHAPHHADRPIGSIQWAAVTDATFGLRRRLKRRRSEGEAEEEDEAKEADDGVRILSGISRWAGEQRTKLQFRGNRYEIMSGPPSLLDRVRRALAATQPGPGLTSKSALAVKVAARDIDVGRAVDELERLGEVRIAGSGKNRYAELKELVPPLPA